MQPNSDAKALDYRGPPVAFIVSRWFPRVAYAGKAPVHGMEQPRRPHPDQARAKPTGTSRRPTDASWFFPTARPS